MSQHNSSSDNSEKLKLYISQSSQPIPDITHQDTNIFSEFKFFFNDDELLIYTRRVNSKNSSQESCITSILHDPDFQAQIQQIYSDWVSNSDTHKLEGQQCQQTDQFRNFISFVDYWLDFTRKQNKKRLYVDYLVYDELIKSAVQNCLNDCIYEVKANLFGIHKMPLKLEQTAKKMPVDDKKNGRSKKNIEKRLQEYFKHFSANRQTVVNLHTFQELGEAYSTIDLVQWVRFSKQFINTKITTSTQIAEQITEKNKGSSVKRKRQKKITVQNLKTIFDKISKNNKAINYDEFKTALYQLYTLIFGKDDKPQENFQNWLNIDSHENWRMKMKDFGVNIPKDQTFIPKLPKSCKKVQAKYMDCYNKENIFGISQASSSKETKFKESQKLKNTKVSLNPVICNKQTIKKHIATRPDKFRKNNQQKNDILNIQQMLGITDDSGAGNNDDEFLNSYQQKASIGVIKRMDDRINKFTSRC